MSQSFCKVLATSFGILALLAGNQRAFSQANPQLSAENSDPIKLGCFPKRL